jgi:hypothetical protein
VVWGISGAAENGEVPVPSNRYQLKIVEALYILVKVEIA